MHRPFRFLSLFLALAWLAAAPAHAQQALKLDTTGKPTSTLDLNSPNVLHGPQTSADDGSTVITGFDAPSGMFTRRAGGSATLPSTNNAIFGNGSGGSRAGVPGTDYLAPNGSGAALTGLTKAQVGLPNVDNTSDANKPISTAAQTALNGKVDKVSGQGLSTNDYSPAEKTKLAGLVPGTTAGTFAAGNDIRLVKSAQLLPYAYRDGARETSDLIDNHLAGLTPGDATQKLFNADGTRNASLWCADLAGDLTCQSSASSSGWRYTAICPGWVMSAAHTGDQSGGTATFTPNDGTAPVTRTLSNRTVVVAGSDLVLYKLSADLPANIVPAVLFPVAVRNPASFVGSAVLYTDAAQKVYVAEIASLQSGSPAVNTVRIPLASNRVAWCKNPGPAVSGDSSSVYGMLRSGRFICLGCFNDGNGNAPDPGANIAAIQAIIGSGYSLTVYNPPAVGSAALLEAGASPGNVPVLDVNGQLPQSALPATNNYFSVIQGTAGSASSTGAGGAAGALNLPLFQVQSGTGGTSSSAGSGGAGGAVSYAFQALAGNGGNSTGSGTFNGGSGGQSGQVILGGGNGGTANGAAGGNGGNSGVLNFSGGKGGGGNATKGTGGKGGLGGQILAKGGSVSGLYNNFAGGDAGYINVSGADSTSTAAGLAGGSLDLSGGTNYPGGTINLANGGRTITLGTGAVITLPSTTADLTPSASVVGIRKGAGAGSADTAATAGTDYAAPAVVQLWDGTANVTVNPATDILLLTAAPSAARTIILPAANARNVGTPLYLEVEQNVNSSNGVTVGFSRAGSDTINTYTLSYTPTNAGAFRYTLIRASATNWSFPQALQPDLNGAAKTQQWLTGNSYFDGNYGLLLAGANLGLRVAPNGSVGFFGQSSDTGFLRVAASTWEIDNGTLVSAGGSYGTLNLGNAVFQAGSASAPSIAIGASNTGLYNAGGQLLFEQNGVLRMYLNNSGQVVVQGGLVVTSQANLQAGATSGGNIAAPKLLGNSSQPTGAAGTGAGSGATVTIVGTDLAGTITVATGTTPAAAATIATLTYSSAFPAASYPVLYPANDAAGSVGFVPPVAGTTTTLTVSSVAGLNLAASTTYVWNYHVLGK